MANFGDLCGIVPYGGGSEGGARSLLLAERMDKHINRLQLTHMDCIASNVRYGYSSRWFAPSAICVHPMRKDHYFIAFRDTVESSDDGGKTLLAGGLQGKSFVDGIGPGAAFGCIDACVSTSDGGTLYVTDVINSSLRSINVATTRVTTLAMNGCFFDESGHPTHESCNPTHESGLATTYSPTRFAIGSPNKLTFYRSPDVKPDSVLFMTTHNQILRYDIASSVMSKVELKSKNNRFDPIAQYNVESSQVPSSVNIKSQNRLSPNAIACTANGTLIFSCARTFSLYVLDPATSELDRIAGNGLIRDSGLLDSNDLEGAKFRIVADLFIDETAQCLWLIDNPRPEDADQSSASVVRRVSIPPRIFWTKP